MADNNNDLIFPMGIDFDLKAIEADWKAKQVAIQKIIDDNTLMLKVKMDVDKQALTDTLKILRDIQAATANIGTAPSSSPAAMLKAKTIADAKAAELATIAEAKAKAILANSDNQAAIAEQRLSNVKQQGVTAATKSTIASTNEAIAEERLARAKNMTAISAQRAARETLGQTSAYRGQFNVIEGLKSAAASYLTVLGGFNVVRSIKSITSQYELQRVALGAIIQDTQRASQLFDQIKTLAVESPFMVKDLVTYTKQLAAYRIETESLFETTSRLADISAGLGVDMSRLILAYGQVRAASVLRGQELRQFTEAGIPLVELLADKFSKLNGEMVSTGQVFKLISQRAVPFKMIKEIFEDMTNAGGSFYNMQKIQAQTLYGVYANLTDAMQIMFDEMGRSQRGLLMGIAKAGREAIKEWRIILSVAEPVILAISAYNIALALNNKLLVAGAATEALYAKARILYTAGMSTAAASTRAAAAANNIFARSFYKLWAAMLANPFAWIIAGLTAVGIGIYKIISYKTKIERMQEEIAKTMSEIKSAADVSVISLGNLIDKLNKANYGSQEYADIVAEINRKYGDFLPNQLKASQSYDEIAKSLQGVTDAIMNQAKAKSYAAGIDKIESNFAEQSSKAYDKAIKALTKPEMGMEIFAFDDKEAAKLIQKGMEQVKANPETYKTAKDIGDLLRKNLNEAWQKKGVVAPGETFKGMENFSISKYVKSVQEMLDPWQQINIETDKFKDKNDAIFSTAKMSNFKKEIEDLDVRYKKLREEKGRQAYADDINGVSVQRNIDLRKLEATQMSVLISIYKKYGMAKQAADTWTMLSNLNNQGKDWQSAIENLLSKQIDKTGRMKLGVSILKPEEEQDYFDYLDELQKSYDKLIAKQRVISTGKLVPGEDITSTQNQLEAIVKVADLLGVTLTQKADKAANPAIARLKEEVAVAEQAYEEYKKLEDQRGAVFAQQYIQKTYSGKSPLGLAFTDSEMQGIYDRAKTAFSKLGKNATDEMGKAILKGTNTIFDSMSEAFKKRLDELSKEISNTQKANDFYEKMLGLTGDVDLSKKIALQVTGFNTGDVAEKLQNQLEAIGKEMNVNVPITVSGKVDIEGYKKAIEDAFAAEKIGKDQKDKLEGYLQAYSDNEAAVISELFSSLTEYQTFEQKKAKIVADGERMAIEARKRGLAGQEAAINKYTTTRQADLEYENFKTTNMYVEMFGDLDNLTTDALEKIKSKLITMSRESLSGLSPTNMKEIVTKIEDLNAKIIERNPFKSWMESLKKVEALKKTISNMESTVDAGKATGLNPALLSVLTTVLANLKTELAVTENSGKKSLKALAGNMNLICSAALEVVGGVKAIFDEFGIGEDTIAGKSLSMLETIGAGVMKVIQTTASVAAKSISTAEKASVILTIISVVLQIALKAYQLFSKEADIARQIEALTKDIEYLQEMYDKLNLKTIYDPQQLDKLQQELGLRKEMLRVTENQASLALPGVETKMMDYWRSAILLVPRTSKDIGNLLTLGVKSFVGAYFEYSKMKKYNELITEANGRLAYQDELYQILNKDINNTAKTAEAKVANLKEQNRLLQMQINAEIALGRKMDVAKVLELQEKMAKNKVDITYAYLDTLNEAVGDIFISMSDGITDALSAAFENGESSAMAFQNTVKDVMKKVVVDLWKVNVLSALLQPAMAEIYKSLGLTADGKVVPGSTPDFKIDSNEMKKIMTAWAAAQSGVVSSWEGLGNILDQLGAGNGTDLTGISKGIATASEESVVTLSGYANSLLYYSVGQYNIQQRMLAIMESTSSAGAGGSESLSVMTNLYNVQAQALSQLQAIAANTSRSAIGTESLVDALNKLSLNGGKSLNVKLVS